VGLLDEWYVHGNILAIYGIFMGMLWGFEWHIQGNIEHIMGYSREYNGIYIYIPFGKLT